VIWKAELAWKEEKIKEEKEPKGGDERMKAIIYI
jgi:hypothetical protein